MESERHFFQMMLLILSLRLAWKDREDYYVGGNMFIYFSETQAKKNDFRGPDVFVVLDTVMKERKSWVDWEEDGKTPDVVIELTSPSTEATDRGEKMRIYSKLLKVYEYFLFDPFTAELEGYRLDLETGGYRPIEPDSKGRLDCRRLGLSLGVVRGVYLGTNTDWLRWFDDQGQILPVGEELAKAETKRALAEARRAEAEAQRAEAEALRAEAEAQRAEVLAERLAEYEEKYGPLD